MKARAPKNGLRIVYGSHVARLLGWAFLSSSSKCLVVVTIQRYMNGYMRLFDSFHRTWLGAPLMTFDSHRPLSHTATFRSQYSVDERAHGRGAAMRLRLEWEATANALNYISYLPPQLRIKDLLRSLFRSLEAFPIPYYCCCAVGLHATSHNSL